MAQLTMTSIFMDGRKGNNESSFYRYDRPNHQLPITKPFMSEAFDCDIAIVGGGPVGTTFACALKNSGFRAVLLDAKPPEVSVDVRRAYAISLLSGRIFEQIGVWEKLQADMSPFRRIRLSDDNDRSVVEFWPQDLDLPQLGYAIEHTPLLSQLRSFLHTCDSVQGLWPAEVVGVESEPEAVRVRVRQDGTERSLRAKLLVAADGSRSRLREAAGIGTRGWKYWQSCLTFRVKPEHPHHNIAYERFWPDGPFAILPLRDDRCNVVWTLPHAKAKAFLELEEDAFIRELSQRYGDRMGKLALDSPRVLFPVQLMHGDRYVKHRLALVGDAAHCCHPVGGQGLNLGIRDAAALVRVLTQARDAGEDIGDIRVLQRYQRWRKGENWTILAFTDLLDRTFSNQWLPLVGLRRSGLWLLRNVPPVKIIALRLMTGLLGRSPV